MSKGQTRSKRWQVVACMDCHGMGGARHRILDDGSGPYDACGPCFGTGRSTRWMNGILLALVQQGVKRDPPAWMHRYHRSRVMQATRKED